MPTGRSSANRARLSPSEAAERGPTAAGRENASARTCPPCCGGELPGARSAKPSRVIHPPTRAGTRNPDRTPLRGSSQRAASRDARTPALARMESTTLPQRKEQASRSRSDPRSLRTIARRLGRRSADARLRQRLREFALADRELSPIVARGSALGLVESAANAGLRASGHPAPDHRKGREGGAGWHAIDLPRRTRNRRQAAL
jgi:hypothetical protein